MVASKVDDEDFFKQRMKVLKPDVEGGGGVERDGWRCSEDRSKQIDNALSQYTMDACDIVTTEGREECDSYTRSMDCVTRA